jgi:hypothetical protein
MPMFDARYRGYGSVRHPPSKRRIVLRSARARELCSCCHGFERSDSCDACCLQRVSWGPDNFVVFAEQNAVRLPARTSEVQVGSASRIRPEICYGASLRLPCYGKWILTGVKALCACEDLLMHMGSALDCQCLLDNDPKSVICLGHYQKT